MFLKRILRLYNVSSLRLPSTDSARCKQVLLFISNANMTDEGIIAIRRASVDKSDSPFVDKYSPSVFFNRNN